MAKTVDKPVEPVPKKIEPATFTITVRDPNTGELKIEGDKK